MQSTFPLAWTVDYLHCMKTIEITFQGRKSGQMTWFAPPKGYTHDEDEFTALAWRLYNLRSYMTLHANEET